METFQDYLNTISPENADKMNTIFDWIDEKYPNLEHRIAWKQPMYTDHGTFIIGFSAYKKHLSIAPEEVVINIFSKRIEKAGYEHTKKLFKINWDQSVDYELLSEIIEFNITEKAHYTSFWRQ